MSDSSPASSRRTCVRGCTGKTTGSSSEPSCRTRVTNSASRTGSSTFVARCAVMSTPRRSSTGLRATPLAASASMTGFPTTRMRSGATPSADRNDAAISVGARWTVARSAITRRFSSSMERSLNERSPASKWTTPTPWRRAAIAVSGAVYVSPRTSTASGRCCSSSSKASPSSVPTRCPSVPDSSHVASGGHPIASNRWPAMRGSVCCPVAMQRTSWLALRSDRTTSASLMTSGRVPIGTVILTPRTPLRSSGASRRRAAPPGAPVARARPGWRAGTRRPGRHRRATRAAARRRTAG